MHEESSSYSHYSYSIDNSYLRLTYVFSTDSGIDYIVYLQDTSDYFSKYPDFHKKVSNFGFGPKITGEQIIEDWKIGNTIIHILCSYLDKYTDHSLIYICDSKDGREAARARKFSIWHTRLNNSGYVDFKVNKYTVPIDDENMTVLVREDCTYHSSIKEIFEHFPVYAMGK